MTPAGGDPAGALPAATRVPGAKAALQAILVQGKLPRFNIQQI